MNNNINYSANIEALDKQTLIEYIKKLEDENEKLRVELAEYQNRKYGGRKKHDETWMSSYNDFALMYDNGMSIAEIVKEGKFSRRTAYRYKAYYDEIKNNQN